MFLQGLYTSSRFREGVPWGGIEEILLPNMPLKRLNMTVSWSPVSDYKPTVLEMDVSIRIILRKANHLGSISGCVRHNLWRSI